ncbi:MAG: PAS domain-containing sensor histidine kinase [Leptospiraceae bacterium]|nr:PAS domain-containing sensor histidine kinase [Leptospiraceae bacterium]
MISGKIQETIFKVSNAGIIRFTAGNSLRIFGYTNHEMTGKNFQEFLPSEIKWEDLVSETKEKSKQTNNCPIRHKNGIVFPFAVVCNPYEISDEPIEFILVLTEDSQENLENTPMEKYNLLSITDLNGKIHFANSAYCEISRYPLSEILGNDYKLFNSGFHSSIFFEEMKNTIHSGKIWRGEIRKQSKEGTIYWVDTILVPIPYIKNQSAQILKIQTDITKQKGDIEFLVSKNNNLEKILNTSPDIIARLDRDFRHIYINSAIEQATGIPVSEFLGKTHSELGIDLDVVKLWHEKFRFAFDTGKEQTYEFDFPTPIGIQYYHCKLIPEPSKTNEITTLLSIARNVTDLKKQIKTEEELDKAKTRYRGLLENLEPGVVVHAADTTVIMNNARACDLLGFSNEQLIGKRSIDPDWKFIHEDNSILHVNDYPVSRIIRQKSPIRNQILGIIRPVTLDTVWVQVNGVPFLNETGDIVEIVISFIDVTSKKQMEDSLQKSEKNYRELYFHNPLMLFTVSKEGIILSINSSTVEELGFHSDELIGKPIFKLYHPDDQPMLSEKFHSVIINSIKTTTWQFRKITKSGEIIWVSETTRFVFENENTPILLITCENITERIRAAEILKQYTEDLEILNNTKDKFFSIIAHDLRNPFTGILGLTEDLLEKIESENEKDFIELASQYLTLIQSSTQSASILLENLLQWSKSQTGDITISPVNLALKKLVLNTIPVLEASLTKKNIQLEINIADDIYVLADIYLTNTVFRNLLSNSVKFSYPNSKIELSAYSKDKFSFISISDSGTGINSENMKKLFRIDSKFTKSGTLKEKGSGLGLILAKEFIEKQGGTIWAESEIGKGSTFTFTLPLGISAQQNPL